jgi:hypothetical protein
MDMISSLCSGRLRAIFTSKPGLSYSEHSYCGHYAPVLLVRKSMECGLRKAGLGEGAALSVKLLGRHDGREL